MILLTPKLFFILFFTFILNLSILSANLTSCPGTKLTALDGAINNTTSNVDRSIPKYTSHYYYFTPAVDGTIQVQSSVNKTYNSLYINEGCTSTITKNENDSNDKALSAYVTAGTKVVIELKRRHNSSANYEIDFSFKLGLDILTSDGRNFQKRHQENLFGDVKVIGNTVLCRKNSNGNCIESGNKVANNDVNLQKAPESSSTLVLPANAKVEYARLYWLGRTDDSWNTTTQALAGKINIKKGSSDSYTELTATIKDAMKYSGDIYLYSASADASAIVTGPGTYYIDTSSFYTVTGKTSDGLGTSGSWALVVVYSDPNETVAKNVTIFDGYKGVTKDDDASASVSGFLTPTSNPVDSTVYIMAAEGDKYLSGTSDQVQMAGATFSTSLKNLGTMDSRIDLDATRTPNLTNNNGTDIHKYNVGSASGGSNIIQANETGAKFNFTSNQDVYYPSLFVFSTQLYLPQLCYDYSLKQDGRYFSIDRAAYPKARIDRKVSSSDIEVGIYLRNKESDLAAEGIAIRTDLNVTKFNQVGNIYTSNVNGTTLIDRGSPTSSSTLCDYDKNANNSVLNSGCTDGHNIRKGNGSLGEYDYVYTKFLIKPQNVSGLVDMNESLGLSMKYYVTADGTKIEYPDYELGGSNVPICPPTAGYKPQWGQFNVVRSGQENDNITNNLYTQVSRKPFKTSVVFDSTPTTGDNKEPETDITTTVLVEMIDIDAYGDINASCANPDASISEPIFVPINFTPSSHQSEIPEQNNDYYNFAVKNATFRVWFFDDNNESLIQNWSAATDASQRTLDSISGLYDSSVHTLCSSSCTTSSSPGCFECIKINYAKPICARDNFSVRPESYSLNIFDINQTLPSYDIITNPGNLKNSTKRNLSIPTGFAADKINPTERLNLASGYNYRFDINASGNDSISFAPGYTRSFSGGNEYNATLYWSDQTKTACNDIDNRNIKFYFQNGKVMNEERLHDNVGEYRLNLIDTTWTAVDWLYTSHHTTSNGFDTNTLDCISNSSSTANNNNDNKNGCIITSNHGTDSNLNNYIDHNLTFHPYKFDTSNITPTVGLNHTPVTAGSYVYMSDISNSLDENMSYHLNGKIVARGYDNTKVSNFVDGCYAKELNLSIQRSTINTPVAYRYRFHSYDENAQEIGSSLAVDLNNSTVPITLNKNIFDKDLNGSATTVLNLNYYREKNTSINPQEISFISYDLNCSTTSECKYFGDLKTKFTKGSKDLNASINIKHYYGRTHAPRQRFSDSSTPTEKDVFIYYEIFCHGTECNKDLLPDKGASKITDDPRWWVNTKHRNASGKATDVEEKSATGYIEVSTTTVPTGDHPDKALVKYTGDKDKGYPYITTMKNKAPSWLIYNKYNTNADTNEFTLEFYKNAGEYVGSGTSNHSVKIKRDTTQLNVNENKSWW